MIRSLEAVQIGSKDATALAKFYEEKVGLKIKQEYEMGDKESAFEMDAGEGSTLMILDMPDLDGKAKEQNRMWLNFEVEDIEKATEEVKKNGVKVLKDTYHIEGYGYLTTFEDLDGNAFSLAQVRANE